MAFVGERWVLLGIEARPLLPGRPKVFGETCKHVSCYLFGLKSIGHVLFDNFWGVFGVKGHWHCAKTFWRCAKLMRFLSADR